MKVRVLVCLVFTFLGLSCDLMAATPAAKKENQPVFKCDQGEVERSGVILIKKCCGKFEHCQNSFLVLIGDNTEQGFWNFPAGVCDPKADKDTSDTAVRELCEETGAGLVMRSKAFKNAPYVYGRLPNSKAGVQLFILRDDTLSVEELTKSVKKAHKNDGFSDEYKEVTRYAAIHVSELIKKLQAIKDAGFPTRETHPGLYTVSTHTKKVEMNSIYMRALAYNLDYFKATLASLGVAW